MERWKAAVPFVGIRDDSRRCTIKVRATYADDTPIVEIDDDLIEKATVELERSTPGSWEVDMANYDGPEGD